MIWRPGETRPHAIPMDRKKLGPAHTRLKMEPLLSLERACLWEERACLWGERMDSDIVERACLREERACLKKERACLH